MEEPWTILELAELAADALVATPLAGASSAPGAPVAGAASADPGVPAGAAASADPGVPAGARAVSGPARVNGRVRDVPNERLIRWYVTVGLVDPPLSRRGRVARYGRRHLLQLVAVKRRQAEGRSLAEIQAELAGATDETLAEVAHVPDARPAPEAPLGAPARFWARRLEAPDADRPGQPVPVAAEQRGQPGPGAAGAVTGERAGPPAPVGYADQGAASPLAGLVHGVRLAPGVTLLLEGAEHEPSPDDVIEIANAAEPLLRELASRRLRASGPGDPGQSPGVGQLTEESST